MRIVFMGTPDYATRILQELARYREFDLVLLVTQEDKPVGRKQILTPPHMKKWALENLPKTDIFQPKTLKEKSVVEKITSYNPDFIIVAAYGKILPKDILDIAPCINLHASILPNYRGASPIQSAILQGDKISGVTAMMMEEGLDCGDILGFRVVDIENKRVDTVFEELALAAARLTIEILKEFDKLNPVKQMDCDATYCIKIRKDNGLITEDLDAKEIYRRFLAYTPWPGIFLKNGLKLKEITLLENESLQQKAFSIEDIKDNSIVISSIKGSFELFKVQAPSKKEIGAVDYIRGKRLKIGDILV